MSKNARPVGVLLLQLGTPASTKVPDVRRYLREFLSDPRVLDIPKLARWLLLNVVILPFRPRRSAEQYEKIWTEDGSPLTIHTETLRDRLQETLGDGYKVAYGMRYQNPPIELAVTELASSMCDRVVVVPLFPQYSSAATGSALEKALDVISDRWNVMNISSVSDFFEDSGFIDSVTDVARPHLEQFEPDHVIFSYHGLPEKHVKKSDPTEAWCLQHETCCSSINEINRFCYRAQSYATTRALAEQLRLGEGTHTTTFQSRLAGQKWIEPYTDKEVDDLYERGVRKLAVLTPSFTSDCLETLEEIGIRLREQWEGIGGEDLLLVPCVNAEPRWVSALADLIRRSP